MRSLLWTLLNLVQAVYTVVWSVLCITAALVARVVTGGPRVPLAMARRIWAPGLLRPWGVRVEVEGLANVDLTRPHFFAANHQSFIDIPALFSVLPVPLLFVVKEELRRVPFLGWYMAAMGMIFIPREQRRRSLANLGLCRQRIAEGMSVLIFPEGTRSRDGRIARLKPGTFVPAIDAGVPVVPVALDGPGRILPRGTFRVRPGPIRIHLGRPIETTGLERGDRRALAQEVRERLVELQRRLDGAQPRARL